MIQTTRQIGTFAFCVMAFFTSTSLTATAARAAPPNWSVNNVELAAGEEEPIEVKLGSEGNLLSNVLKHMIRITCPKVNAKFGTRIKAGGTVAGELEFKECKTFYGGKENDVHTAPTEALPLVEACKPQDPIVAAGKGRVVFHENAAGQRFHLIELEQNGAGSLAVIKLGSECAAGEEFAIIGSVFLEDIGGNLEFLREWETHTFREAVGPTLALGGLLFGVRAASLDGTAIVDMLLGMGRTWHGIPA